MNVKKFCLTAILVLAMLMVFVGTVSAWNWTVNVNPTCDNVQISVNAQNEGNWTYDHSDGVGTFNWSSNGKFDWSVTAWWKKWNWSKLSWDWYSENKTGTAQKPNNCQENTLDVTPNSACDGWSVTAVASSGANIDYDPGQSGSWGSKNWVEVHVHAHWTSGNPREVNWNQKIYKPSDEQCRKNSATFSVENSCSGWKVQVNASEGAHFSEPSGSWSNPYELETVAAQTIVVNWDSGTPSSVSLDIPTINEPNDCLQYKHEAEVNSNADCDGFSFSIKTSAGGVPALKSGSESGSWSNPYGSESASVVYSVSWPDGFSQDFSGSVDKPEGCIKHLEHDASITANANCDGFSFSIDAKGGTATIKSGAETGSWSNPYGPETASITYHVKWDDGFEDDFSKSVSKPDDCIINLEHHATITKNATCDGWEFSISVSGDGEADIIDGTESGSWAEGQTSASITYEVTWPDGYIQDFSDSVSKPDDCTTPPPNHNWAVINFKTSCNGWSISVSASQGAKIKYSPKKSGNWKNSSKIKASVDVSWDTGEPQSIHKEKTLKLPGKCTNGFVILAPPTCPTCGPRVDEIAKGADDVVIVQYAKGDCHVCMTQDWGLAFDSLWQYARAPHPFSILVSAKEDMLKKLGIQYRKVVTDLGVTQIYIDAPEFKGVDGVSYYILDLPRSSSILDQATGKIVETVYVGDNWYFVDTASGKSYTSIYGWQTTTRSLYPGSCARTVGPWDVSANGMATHKFGGTNSSEWVTYLLSSGAVPKSFAGADTAIQWSLDFWKTTSDMLIPGK